MTLRKRRQPTTPTETTANNNRSCQHRGNQNQRQRRTSKRQRPTTFNTNCPQTSKGLGNRNLIRIHLCTPHSPEPVVGGSRGERNGTNTRHRRGYGNY